MAEIKDAIYKVNNGTDFDTIHFETKASQVKMVDGSNVEQEVKRLEMAPNSNISIKHKVSVYRDTGKGESTAKYG